jgi:DNA-binding IclR family transcriptional regulator
MASMSTEIAVLRALLRFSRRRTPATFTDLLQRVGADPSELSRALGSLARSQLVQRSGETARLSMAGLAIAVAAAANARRAKTVARPARPSRAKHEERGARVIAISRSVRRHRAA